MGNKGKSAPRRTTTTKIHMPHNLHDTFKEFKLAAAPPGRFYSLPRSEAAGVGKISRLPVSIHVGSVLRNSEHGKKVSCEGVSSPTGRRTSTRTTGSRFRPRARACSGFAVAPPDLAAMRNVAADIARKRRRSSRSSPSTSSSTTQVMIDYFRRRIRAQHEARVLTQRRALSVHEMGDAAVSTR